MALEYWNSLGTLGEKRKRKIFRNNESMQYITATQQVTTAIQVRAVQFYDNMHKHI